MTKKKIILILVPVILIILICVGMGQGAIYAYNSNFAKRYETAEESIQHVEDFQGLECEECKFPSNNGQLLKGYMFSAGEGQRGIVVIAHGFGAGFSSYMKVANYFAQNGYYVFAYDATGNDASEGDGVGGFPQGVIDLEYAISFVETGGYYPDLPIVLYGHSWGGYSVCGVLSYHPEVKAVVECSGFSSSTEMVKKVGSDSVGGIINVLMPSIKLYESIKFGEYSSNTGVDGLANSNAAVMIVQGENDDVVPREYGYDIYYEQFKDNPRFDFVMLPDRGHYDIIYDWNNPSSLDEDLMGQFLEFYNDNI